MLAVDLDETLLKVNSFPLFVGYLLRTMPVQRRFRLTLRLMRALVRRKLLRGSHHDFKATVTRIDAQLPADLHARFAARMVQRHANEEVVRLIADWDGQVVLCTSAPQAYAASIGSALGCDVVQGSRVIGGTLVDNVGITKADRLRAVANAGIEVAVSDDEGLDAPLLDLARRPIVAHGGRLRAR